MTGTARKGIVVQKYGGSSVADTEKMRAVAAHIQKTAENKKVAVVVSAMGKETDRLIQLAEQVYGQQPPKRELDRLLATGEEKAASLLAMAIQAQGVAAAALNGREIGLEADQSGRIRKIHSGPTSALRGILERGEVPVITGFQGVKEGTQDVITLGRGGSDLTAIAVAGVLGAEVCEIYTDVDGVFQIDPRVIPEAKRFDTISYDQMIQLSGVGAGVMMDRSVILAQKLGVKIRVLLSPSFGESTGGTLICSGNNMEEMECAGVKPGIAVQQGSLIEVSNAGGFLSEVPSQVFRALSSFNIIDSTQLAGENTTIFLFCLSDDLPLILSRLRRFKEEEEVRDGIGVSEEARVVGLTLAHPLMKEESGYLARVSGALREASVHIKMLSSSGTTILAIVGLDELAKAAKALAEEFGLV